MEMTVEEMKAYLNTLDDDVIVIIEIKGESKYDLL